MEPFDELAREVATPRIAAAPPIIAQRAGEHDVPNTAAYLVYRDQPTAGTYHAVSANGSRSRPRGRPRSLPTPAAHGTAAGVARSPACAPGDREPRGPYSSRTIDSGMAVTRYGRSPMS